MEKLVDCVCCYRWENSVACDISVVGSMGKRHVAVIIMVEVTGGITKIAVPVICLQSENNMQCKLY